MPSHASRFPVAVAEQLSWQSCRQLNTAIESCDQKARNDVTTALRVTADDELQQIDIY